jgi:sugar phosphate isomerase/epimerase
MSIPVSLQLWSVREATAKDFAATVKAVAAMGYRGVELAGYGNLDAKGVAAAVREAGLAVSGMHVGWPQLSANLSQVISDALLLGTKHVACPSWPREHFVSGAACAEIGRRLGEVGATLRSVGIQLSFHNHGSEMAVVDGRRVMDWMLDAAEPRNLAAQVDVYWVQMGGSDPSAYLRELGRRVRTVHLKDEKEIGLGPVDFAPVFEAIDGIGSVEWNIVEVEQYSHAPLESVRLSLEQLKKWGRA